MADCRYRRSESDRPSKAAHRSERREYRSGHISVRVACPNFYSRSMRRPLRAVPLQRGHWHGCRRLAVGDGLSAVVGICSCSSWPSVASFSGGVQTQNTTHQVDARGHRLSPVVHLLPLPDELQLLTGFQSFAIQRWEGDLGTLPVPTCSPPAVETTKSKGGLPPSTEFTGPSLTFRNVRFICTVSP